MPEYTFKGISKKEQDERFEKQRKNIVCADARGIDVPFYYIDKDDPEDLKELKRKRKADYIKEREAEIKAGLEADSKKMVIGPFVFEAGKAVFVDAKNQKNEYVATKLENMSKNGGPFKKVLTKEESAELAKSKKMAAEAAQAALVAKE